MFFLKYCLNNIHRYTFEDYFSDKFLPLMSGDNEIDADKLQGTYSGKLI